MSADDAIVRAIETVDRHGDVAPRGNHSPQAASIRTEMIAKHIIAWDGDADRYYVTANGRAFQMRARGRGEPARNQVVAFRRPLKPSR